MSLSCLNKVPDLFIGIVPHPLQAGAGQIAEK
jgi:hypothetical protein